MSVVLVHDGAMTNTVTRLSPEALADIVCRSVTPTTQRSWTACMYGADGPPDDLDERIVRYADRVREHYPVACISRSVSGHTVHVDLPVDERDLPRMWVNDRINLKSGLVRYVATRQNHPERIV